SDDVKTKSKLIFTKLGEAEAKVHDVDIEEVHFHEVGAVDSIVDIVGSVIGISILGIDKIYSSPLPLGQGFVKSSHGIIPVPAPATVELLKGIPTKRTEIQGELVTPTGAAIISTLAEGFGIMPEMVIDKVGYGSGTKELAEQPNLLRVILGTKENSYESDTINIIETNIDDMSSQIYDQLIDKLLAIGAVDVFMTPIIMKKSRPAVKLTVLIDSEHLQEACNSIFAETTTMGVRIYEANRKKLSREMIEVETEYGKVSVKLGKIGDEVLKVLPEYDDCKRLSIKNNVPIMKINQAVLKALNI
ncbi:MAG: putative nickel insertion protein, partial [Candidatus Poribacteria bacterium]|nr:putative nickel insertion protein [Candidatus Poribacteria bacterium]